MKLSQVITNIGVITGNTHSPSSGSPCRIPDRPAPEAITNKDRLSSPAKELHIRGVASENIPLTAAANQSVNEVRISSSEALLTTSWSERARKMSVPTEHATSPIPMEEAISRPVPNAEPITANSPVNNGDPTVKALGDIFAQIVDAAMEMSTLNLEKSKRRSVAERRNADWEKSKKNHDKFPAIQEAQLSAREEAERSYSAASKKLEKTNESSKQLLRRIASEALPQLLIGVSSNIGALPQTQQHIKTLESRCQGFEQTFNKMKEFMEKLQKDNDAQTLKYAELESKIAAQQKISLERTEKHAENIKNQAEMAKKLDLQQKATEVKSAEVEKKSDDLVIKHASLENRMSSDQSQCNRDREKLEGVVELSQSIQTQLVQAKRDMTDLVNNSVPSDLLQQLRKLSQISVLRADLGRTSERSSENKESIKALDASLFKVTKSSAGLIQSHATLIESQNAFHELLGALTSRVKKLENPDPLQDNVKIRLEEVEYDLLKERVRKLELDKTSPVPAHKPLPTPVDTSVIKRLTATFDARNGSRTSSPTLESRITPRLNFSSPTLESRLRSLEEVQGNTAPSQVVEMRLSALESRPQVSLDTFTRTAHESNTLPRRLNALNDQYAAASDLTDVRSVVSNLEKRIIKIDARPLVPQGATSNAAAGSTEFLDLRGIISNLEEQRLQMNDRLIEVEDQCLVLSDGVGAIINQKVAETAKNIDDRLATIEATVEASASKESHDKLEVRLAEAIEKQNQVILNSRNAQNEDILNAKNTLVGAAAGNAISIIANRNMFAPASLTDSVTQGFNGVRTDIEANRHATANLQTRMDNLNTGELHRAILGEMQNVYPQFNNAENALSAMRLTLHNVSQELAAAKRNIQAIQDKPAANIDDTAIKALRDELGELTSSVNNLQESVQKAEEKVASNKKASDKNEAQLGHLIAENYDKLDAGLDAAIEKSTKQTDGKVERVNDSIDKLDKKVGAAVEKSIEETDSKIERVSDQVEKLNEKVGMVMEKVDKESKSLIEANRKIKQLQSRSPILPPVGRGIPPVKRNDTFATANRRGSMNSMSSEGPNHGSIRKRGRASNTPNGPKGAHGYQIRGTGQNGSPATKKRRNNVKYDEDDDEIPQPRVDTDDEE